MKILQICNKPPYPAVDGGTIAMLNVSRALIEANHQVKILAMSTYKHPANRELMPDDFIENTQFESVFVDVKVRAWNAFWNLFSNKSYHIERFVSKNFERKLIQVLSSETFDIIQLESIFVAPYIAVIRKYSKAKIILHAHNVEHHIWQRIANNTKNFFKKKYIRLLAKRLKKFELSQLNKCDGVTVFTDKDLNYFKDNGCIKPLVKIPFGIIVSHLNDNIAVEYPSLFYVGAMDWIPNEEGMLWFLDEVWPQVNEKFPDLMFYLAGRKMPVSILRQKWSNVVVLGEVEDAFTFMRSKAIMVAPLLSGSGIRVKIIEAMNAGKPVITTTVGAEGIDYNNGRNILIADTPEEFAEAVQQLVTSLEYFETIGLQAKELVEKDHNIDVVIHRLVDFYQILITKN